MKIQNYGEWKGSKARGHHPPACTCYQCNEEQRRLKASEEEERRVKEYDKRVAENQARKGVGDRRSPPNRPPQTSSQQRAAEAVRKSGLGAHPAARPRATLSSRRTGTPRSKVFEVSRAVTASALRYALALHAVGVVGLVVYALTQGGTPSVMPTLDGAAETYVYAWRSVGNIAGLY